MFVKFYTFLKNTVNNLNTNHEGMYQNINYCMLTHPSGFPFMFPRGLDCTLSNLQVD